MPSIAATGPVVATGVGGGRNVSSSGPLGHSDVGRRVSVRHWVADPMGARAATDVVGELAEADGSTLSIRRRDGFLVQVPVDSVIAARRVPPAPPRRIRTAAEIGARDLEAIAWTGWPGLEQEHLGEWVLRAAGGFTGRANSALPLGEPGCPWDEALAHVCDFYGGRGLRPMFQVPLPLARADDDRLDHLGWTVHDPVHVMVCDVEQVVSGTPRRAELPAVEVSPDVDDDWLLAYHYRGGHLPPHARAVITAGAGAVFATVRGDHGVEAIARAAVAQRWVGVTAVEVSPRSRRRGLGTHIMRELVAWAGRAGARHVYLQVAADNDIALALYGRMRFQRHHDYHYRVAPGEPGFAI